MMKKGIVFVFLLIFCSSACQAQPVAAIQPPTAAPQPNLTQPSTAAAPSFKLSSPVFALGQTIPDQYACQGDQIGRSPELTWENTPAGTHSLALFVEDPDALLGVFYHWVIYNIPPGLTDMPEGMPVTGRVVGIGTQGKNSFGALGYGGPCPPFGQTHRYYFHLFALDLGLTLPEGLDVPQLKAKIQDHILAQTDWMGKYK